MGPLDIQPEEDEDVYYRRIFKRKPQESDTVFEKRVAVIKKYHPELKVWKDDIYKSYVTQVEHEDQHITETEVTESSKNTFTRSVTQSESPVTTEVCISFSVTTLMRFNF